MRHSSQSSNEARKRRASLRSKAPVFVISLIVLGASAQASPPLRVDMYAGTHSVWPLPPEATLGVRGSYDFGKHWSAQVAASGLTGDLTGAAFLDTSMAWLANRDDRAVFCVYGGAGGMFFTGDESMGFLTLHLGAGVVYSLTQRTYVRADVIARGLPKYESFEGWEATVGFGFNLGR